MNTPVILNEEEFEVAVRSTTIRITHERQLEMPTNRSAAAATLSVH
jgi:hypothetical protein